MQSSLSQVEAAVGDGVNVGGAPGQLDSPVGTTHDGVVGNNVGIGSVVGGAVNS